MNPNENGIDRLIRLVIAVAAYVGAFAVGITSVLGIVLAVVGTIMLLTGIVGFCPLYRLVGLSTCRIRVPSTDATTTTKTSAASAA